MANTRASCDAAMSVLRAERSQDDCSGPCEKAARIREKIAEHGRTPYGIIGPRIYHTEARPVAGLLFFRLGNGFFVKILINL